MSYYYLILSFHLIAIITWITSLVYMQRLIFLQVEKVNSKLLKEGYFVFESLAKPAFLLTIVFGVVLVVLNKGLLSSGFWIYVKFFFISLIIILHHLCKINLKELESNSFKTKKQNVIYHSFAPLVLVSIVAILTITKAF